MRLGLRIKELRAQRNVSQEQFAYDIGMDRSYYASIEVGRRNVTLLNLAKIARGFDVTLAELLEGVSIPESFEYDVISFPGNKLPTSRPPRKR